MSSSRPRKFVIDMYSSREPGWCMPEEDVERVRGALPEGWELARLREETEGSGDGVPRVTEALREAVREAEVYVGFGIAEELFRAAEDLRWVHSGAAGVGGSLFPEMVESDAIFTNSAGVHAVPVAEHALALMLFFARGLDRAMAAKHEAKWARGAYSDDAGSIRELQDAVLGIVGYGGIGRALGRRAHALGMRVWALKRNPDALEDDLVERALGPDDLDELLAGSDYVVLALPHTAETDGLIGAEELARMRPDAVLINVARGAVVNEDALAREAAAGRLRGAGIDAFRTEPLPAGNAFWSLDNVCITPHIAGVSPRFWERETELILENTRRYLSGTPMLNVVNKQAGY